jgi:hypothetical protein
MVHTGNENDTTSPRVVLRPKPPEKAVCSSVCCSTARRVETTNMSEFKKVG